MNPTIRKLLRRVQVLLAVGLLLVLTGAISTSPFSYILLFGGLAVCLVSFGGALHYSKELAAHRHEISQRDHETREIIGTLDALSLFIGEQREVPLTNDTHKLIIWRTGATSFVVSSITMWDYRKEQERHGVVNRRQYTFSGGGHPVRIHTDRQQVGAAGTLDTDLSVKDEGIVATSRELVRLHALLQNSLRSAK